MGGNALASFGARRYSKEDTAVIRYELLAAIEQDLPKLKFQEIPYYRMKDSFGDLDILVEGPLTEKDYDVLHCICGPDSPRINNGGVMSTMYDQLQIDFIPMPAEDYDTALTYYSYNDLGNLMGKLFHKFGLKYGHRGLTLPMRDGDNQYDELMVSKDAKPIFDFLGLSYERFKEGFDTLEDIFTYVVMSPYFSSEPFQYENLNHTNRIRDRKRTTYHAFLEFIKNEENQYTFLKDKREYLPGIFNSFPGVQEQFNESLKKLEFRLRVRQHFNGEKVREWTGLTGLTLGKFMHRLKADRGEFHSWVLSYTEESLKDICLERLDDFHTFARMSTLDYPWIKDPNTGKWKQYNWRAL